MAETKVTQNEITFSKTTDANGWTVYDYGAFKMYARRVSVNTTIGGGSFSSGTLSLPVGITNTGGVNIWCGSFHGYIGRIFFNLDNNNLTDQTSVNYYFWNQTGSNIPVSGYGYIYMITL